MTTPALTLSRAMPCADKRPLRYVPALLIGLRCLLGPSLILLVRTQSTPTWIVACLLGAMMSDILDGVVARRLGIATAPLRVADSRADAWFFACVGLSAWLAAPEVIRAHMFPFAATLVLQAASYIYDLARYRRIVCLHAYSAKLWGFSLYLAASALLTIHSGAMIWVSFAIGLVCFIDASAIKLILPGWRHDVPSCLHAFMP